MNCRTPAQLAHDIAAARAGGFALGVKLVRGAYHPHEIAAHLSVTSPEVSTPAPAPSSEVTKKSKTKTKDRVTLSISPEPVPPVWLVKEDSDACYNACVAMLVGAVAQDLRAKRAQPGVGVLFGTHNWRSCDVVLDELVRAGLATREVHGGDGESKVKEVVTIPDEVCERVTMGQLYGMSDALTESIVERTRTSTPFVIKYVTFYFYLCTNNLLLSLSLSCDFFTSYDSSMLTRMPHVQVRTIWCARGSYALPLATCDREQDSPWWTWWRRCR